MASFKSLDSSKDREKIYRSVDGVHYSLLSKIGYDTLGAKAILDNKQPDPTEYQLIGRALESKIFDPDFDKKFYVMKAEMPSEKMLLIANWFIENEAGFNEANSVLAAQVADYRGAKVESKVHEHVQKGAYPYIMAVREAKGKQIITPQIDSDASAMMMGLTTHPWTSGYFINHDKNRNIEIRYQVPLYTKMTIPSLVLNKPSRSILFKGLLDILIIDHDNKILKPIDLKYTGGYLNSFRYDFVKWNYYIQGSLYQKLLIEIRKEHSVFKDYEVAPFEFIVASSKTPDKPGIYKCTDNDFRIGALGGKTKSGHRVKGWIELTNDLFWHKENNEWDYTKEFYINNGKVNLDVFETYEKATT